LDQWPSQKVREWSNHNFPTIPIDWGIPFLFFDIETE